MDYKKFTEVENHYRTKHIEMSMDKDPQLRTCKYINWEKLDGANFQLIITKDSFQCGKKSSILPQEEKFFNWKQIISEPIYQDFIARVQQWIAKEQTYTFLGEFFGEGIQGRCNYGPKQFMFYGMKINNVYVSPKYFITTMNQLGFQQLLSPILGIYDSFEEAFSQSELFDSKVINDENNPAEGFVIWPYDYATRDHFLIKKKNESFEKAGKEKKKKIPKEIPEHVAKVMDAYNSYLTSNRLLDMFGKEGMIESHKEMGKYIKLMMEDAKGDFLKDHMDEFNALTDKEKGGLFKSTGSIVVELLKDHL